MLKIQKCWTIFISFCNEVKTECNNFKPDKNLYVLKFVGYLIWGLQRTELWAVVVALYGFCQGGENKRYVLSIAPTTVYIQHTWYTISILKTVKGHANGTIYHVGLKHSFYGTIEWQHFFSPEPACLSFSLSLRDAILLCFGEKKCLIGS